MSRVILLAVCALLLSVQLFLPPFCGLANNGDFARITGWLSIGPKENGWSDNFRYFVSEYIHAPQYSWHSGVYSSETVLAWLGVRLGLDIRFVGLVHALLLLTAFWIALPRIGVSAAIFAVLVFTDLAYTAYLNSFYTDTAAFLGLLLMVALAPRGGVWFAAAALLFIFSKPQHGILGFFPAAVLWRRGTRALACALAAAALLSPFTVPPANNRQALFSLIFAKLARNTEDLHELGLPDIDAAYIGMNAYTPGMPVNEAWLEGFARQTGYLAVAKFYLTHPVRTAAILSHDLTSEAFEIRPLNLNTARREDAGRKGFRNTYWSDFRRWLFRVWPWHILLWYLLVFWFALKDRSGLLLWLCALAFCEFCVASLTDAVETYRHLFIFHVITDVTICLAVFRAGRLKPFRYAGASAPRRFPGFRLSHRLRARSSAAEGSPSG